MTTIDLLDTALFTEGRDSEAFGWLRENDPLHWQDERDGGPGFWSVTRYDDIRAVASDAASFCNGQGTQLPSRKAEGEGRTSLHNSDAPRHLQLRKLVTPYLRPTKVAPVRERIASLTDELLDRMEGRDSVELVHALSADLPLLVFGTLLGVPPEDCPRLLAWTNASSSADPEYAAAPDAAAVAREELFTYFRELEALRRAEPQEDLISVLATARIDDRPLTRDELDPYYLLLTVAGNETTRNLITGGLLLLSDNPAQWHALRDDASRLPLTIEEIVRLVSPVLHMRRTATRDTELHGKTIRAGDKLVMWFAAGNRDPRAFEEPESFLGDRTPNEHLGFGWGSHACMGAHLARLELQVLLERLLARGLHVRHLGEPDRLQSNFFRGIKRLPVTLDRQPVASR
jgi:cytochrome P450